MLGIDLLGSACNFLGSVAWLFVLAKLGRPWHFKRFKT
jgi:hypothetical protein